MKNCKKHKIKTITMSFSSDLTSFETIISDSKDETILRLTEALRKREEFMFASMENRAVTSLVLPKDTKSFPSCAHVNIHPLTGDRLCSACKKTLWPPPITICTGCGSEIHLACNTIECLVCKGTLTERWFEHLFGSFNLAILFLSAFGMYWFIPFQVTQRLLFPRFATVVIGARNMLFLHNNMFIFSHKLLKFVWPCQIYFLGGFSKDQYLLDEYNSFTTLILDTFPSLKEVSGVVSFLFYALPLNLVVLLRDPETIQFLHHLLILNPMIVDFPVPTCVFTAFVFGYKLSSGKDPEILLSVSSIILSAIVTFIVVYVIDLNEETFKNEENKLWLLFSTHLVLAKWTGWVEKKLTQKQLWLTFAYSLTVLFLFVSKWNLDLFLRKSFTALF